MGEFKGAFQRLGSAGRTVIGNQDLIVHATLPDVLDATKWSRTMR